LPAEPVGDVEAGNDARQDEADSEQGEENERASVGVDGDDRGGEQREMDGGGPTGGQPARLDGEGETRPGGGGDADGDGGGDAEPRGALGGQIDGGGGGEQRGAEPPGEDGATGEPGPTQPRQEARPAGVHAAEFGGAVLPPDFREALLQRDHDAEVGKRDESGEGKQRHHPAENIGAEMDEQERHEHELAEAGDDFRQRLGGGGVPDAPGASPAFGAEVAGVVRGNHAGGREVCGGARKLKAGAVEGKANSLRRVGGAGRNGAAMSLRASLKILYRRLPVLREICQIRELVWRLKTEVAAARLEAAIAAEDALQRHPRYGDPRRLHAAAFRAFSQHGEDGMIAEIFRRIGAPTKTFVEIGTGDGMENNTVYLLRTGWSGWWCEGCAADVGAIRKIFAAELADGRLRLLAGMLTPAEVAGALQAAGVPGEPDLLSLDVDQHTWRFWAALTTLRPRAVVIEYNGIFRPPAEWIAPADAPAWDGSVVNGASLAAFERLGRERGYALVGCDLTGTNAFFVRADLTGEKFLAPFDAATHYEPPRLAESEPRRAADASLAPRAAGLG
jgi:hypothetical protein